MPVHLALHLHHGMADLGGQGAIIIVRLIGRLVGQYRQGGFQGMGQIARMGAGPVDDGGLMAQQIINFIGQRLDFAGKSARQSIRPAGPNVSQGPANPGQGAQADLYL
jgi:hypothetical protein